MPPDKHRCYKLVLKLYPKAHRHEYGEQMLQTLDDLLTANPTPAARRQVWLRLAIELPHNLIEEHIHNREEHTMNGKKLAVILGAAAVIFLTVGALVFMFRPDHYQPMTFAKVSQTTAPVRCLQGADNPSLNTGTTGQTDIINALAMSITDVPPGTHIDVSFKTSTQTAATGTVKYAGKYGSYNFVANKTGNASINGGWVTSRFVACQSS